MTEERTLEIVNANCKAAYDRCIELIQIGELDAAVRNSADLNYHAKAFAGWYFPKRNRKRRQRNAA